MQNYPLKLRDMLEYLAADAAADPRVVLLTPGIYNSAYFEHSFLAQQMGIELVEGRDLVVEDGMVLMRTTRGFERVDVIYRRIDDDFLDPTLFPCRLDAGCAGPDGGLQGGQRRPGQRPRAPAWPMTKSSMPTCRASSSITWGRRSSCRTCRPTSAPRKRTCATRWTTWTSWSSRRPTNRAATACWWARTRPKQQRAEFAEKVKANPRNYIAQPTLALSRVPTICGDHFEGRHVDLRPYILYGKEIFVLPGGLTRVALKKGSLVVNSSQGGGSKDTWVLADAPTREARAGQRSRAAAAWPRESAAASLLPLC